MLSAYAATINSRYKCRERASTVPQGNLPLRTRSGESAHRTISPECVRTRMGCTADRSMPGPYIGANPNRHTLPGSQKIQYTFCAKCAILMTACAGMGRPGQRKTEKRNRNLRAERPSTRRYRVKGDGAGRFRFMRKTDFAPHFERSYQINWLKN